MTRPAMIFAAGFGSRMGALTRTRPKPLISVDGQALLDRSLDLVRGAGCAPLVVNAHYRADQIAAHLKGVPDVRVQIEHPVILDTGGGLKAVLPLLGDATEAVTLNSDAVFTGPNPMLTLSRGWRGGEMGALLHLVPAERAVGRKCGGDFTMDAGGHLTRSTAGLIFTGAQIVELSAIRAIGDEVFSMNVVWDKLAKAGRLFGVLHPGHWADVGHPEGIVRAEAMLADAT